MPSKPTPKLYWESVDCREVGENIGIGRDENFVRAQVPGGWLVYCYPQGSMAFVPDTEQAWKPE
jgi:hypothetical protein